MSRSLFRLNRQSSLKSCLKPAIVTNGNISPATLLVLLPLNMILLDEKLPCPCGKMNGKQFISFGKCCKRFLDHFESTPAPDAESLMRSRYCAFVLERARYLSDTWSPAHRPVSLDFDPDAKWLGLEVKAHCQIDTLHAEVEFIARQRLHGKATRLHERSRFIYEDGRWFYIDGYQPG